MVAYCPRGHFFDSCFFNLHFAIYTLQSAIVEAICKLQVANIKMQNEHRKSEELSERFLDFASETIHLINQVKKSHVTRQITLQLLRSATSCGANYEEACGAESRSDFLHKLQIVLKELRESHYWLKLLERTDNSVPNEHLPKLVRESRELTLDCAPEIGELGG